MSDKPHTELHKLIDATQSKYFAKDLDKLQRDIGEWRDKKGFITDGTAANTVEKLILIHEEVTEAFQWIRKPERDWEHSPTSSPDFAEELADIIIRVLDLAEGCDIAIADAIASKMEKNEGRPYKHGKRF